MRVVEADRGNAESAPRSEGLPGNLIRIAGFDEVRLFALQGLLDEVEIDQGTIAGRPRNQRRLNGIDSLESLDAALGLFARNDEHVAISCYFQVTRFLRDITPHPPREGRVELGEIANDHGDGRPFKTARNTLL